MNVKNPESLKDAIAVPDSSSNSNSNSNPKLSIAMALACFACWGLSPLYFKLVKQASPLEVLSHRAIWSFLLLGLIIIRKKMGGELLAVLRSPRQLKILVATSVLISANWLIYIWAISTNQLLSISLGYFINPILSIFLALIFLREELNNARKIALVLTLIAVFIQIIAMGTLPLLSIATALTFAFYGLLRKMVVIPSIIGLTLETLIMLPFSIACLVYFAQTNQLSFGYGGVEISLLLMSAGPVTAIPLLLFVASSRGLTLSTLGFLQYLSPTLQFLLAIFAFHEPLSQTKLASFVLIWLALGIVIGGQSKLPRRARK